ERVELVVAEESLVLGRRGGRLRGDDGVGGIDSGVLRPEGGRGGGDGERERADQSPVSHGLLPRAPTGALSAFHPIIDRRRAGRQKLAQRGPMVPPSSSAMCCSMIASNEGSASKPRARARAGSNFSGQPATMRAIVSSGSR